MKSIILQRVLSIFTYFSPVTTVLLVLLAIYFVAFKLRRRRIEYLIGKVPGPQPLPLIGNMLEVSTGFDELFARLTGVKNFWGRNKGICRAWLLNDPYIYLTEASKVEVIMSSPKHIDKSQDYDYLHPWLGTGLLTSRGKKWHARRKILTPTFHFKILEDFIDVFQEQSAVLVTKLTREIGKEEGFNLFKYVTLCTLDIICETAMGKSIDAQSNGDSQYVKAVYKIGEIVQTRQVKVWYHPEFLFRMSKLYQEHQSCIKTLHGFSNRVIKERKAEIAYQNNNNNNNQDNNNSANVKNLNLQEETDDNKYEILDFPRKKRLAFLDLLIEASKDGKELSDEDIREEVDTFMFEGHDTTSASICWTLFLLGTSPHIQEKVVEELDSIFDGDRTRPPTMKELNDMKYLECTIKESLRLYPSVPFLGRHLHEDVQIGEYLIPAG
ncbi:cytochrome P450 4c3, partial [Contarinia nasturtii]|uniref:cytochrome P450 4c3 n=1 Tax=Contarinia nasturtii TaxID=265458 RepID=UPI0012D3A72D